jgi:hypothetical protein
MNFFFEWEPIKKGLQKVESIRFIFMPNRVETPEEKAKRERGEAQDEALFCWDVWESQNKAGKCRPKKRALKCQFCTTAGRMAIFKYFQDHPEERAKIDAQRAAEQKAEAEQLQYAKLATTKLRGSPELPPQGHDEFNNENSYSSNTAPEKPENQEEKKILAKIRASSVAITLQPYLKSIERKHPNLDSREKSRRAKIMRSEHVAMMLDGKATPTLNPSEDSEIIYGLQLDLDLAEGRQEAHDRN